MTGANLGITIEPEQVRLQPKTEDSYNWRYLPEKQHLFAKQLSKHSVEAYLMLCREIDTSFEAVAQPDATKASSQPGVRAHYQHAKGLNPMENIDARMKELQTENDKLSTELKRLEEEAQSKKLVRCQAERKIQQLELDLSTVRAENTQLSITIDRLTKR